MNGNTIPDIPTAEAKVIQYHGDGYDFLKIHPGIKLDVFKAMVLKSKELGMKYAGHVPSEVGIRRALEAEYESVDHIDGYVQGLVREMDDPNAGGFFGFDLVDEVDITLLDGLADLTMSKQVYIVPTQTLFTRWLSPEDPLQMMQAKEMSYLPPSMRYQWTQGKQNLIGGDNYSAEKHNQYIELRHLIIQRLKDRGVTFLLGSDAPQVMNVPGFSIQHEMQSMVAAGFTPYEVLKSGTRNVAQFFNQDGEYGTIQPGASADLILLEANPLDNIENMAAIAGVMVRGHWITKAEIDQRLDQIAIKNQ